VLSLRYDLGVLNLADRRATAGNLIMYDQAEKIMALDDSTVIAISGAFARSIEVCRFLKHSFKYYRRSVLQEMSLDGKLAEISRALAATRRWRCRASAFSYRSSPHTTSGRTTSACTSSMVRSAVRERSYACAGSGSERIRGVFEYCPAPRAASKPVR